MATVAIGDIHGNLRELEDLLAKVVPTLRPSDTLVFLGDYIDVGPDSRGCLELIIQLKRDRGFTVVTLLGNHEEWMLKARRDPTSHSWLLGMDSFTTIASYSVEAAAAIRREAERLGPRLILEKVPLPYGLFFDSMSAEHLRFFDDLVPYYRSENLICVHGGVDTEGRSLVKGDLEVLLWGAEGFPESYRGRDPVVYGHWGNANVDSQGWPQPCVKDNLTFGIDSISKGVLTAMRFPDGRVFQSSRHAPSARDS
jgi:serine/threonine protein phosphatase 1